MKANKFAANTPSCSACGVRKFAPTNSASRTLKGIYDPAATWFGSPGWPPLFVVLALFLASLACARSEIPITPVQIGLPTPSAEPAVTSQAISFVPTPAPTRVSEPTPTLESFSLLPANVETADALATALLLTLTPETDTPLPLSEPSPTLAPTEVASLYPFISDITPRAREIFLRGQALGNRPNVFSKIGDSITESAVFLNPIGNKSYYLYDDYAYLQPVVDYFSTEAARGTLNSFNNPSLAAKTNWRARAMFSPASADAATCAVDEPPLMCEYRLVRPAIALIMLGTNDVPYTPLDEYEADMRRVIDYSIERGVIPVLSTIPHLEREGLSIRAEQLNQIIIKLAQEYQIPLWDYYASLDALPNQGVGEDGIHPTWAPVGHSADFTSPYLDYGMTVRNLMALQVLDAVWRDVINN